MRFGISATSSILPKNLRTRLRPVNVCTIVASLLPPHAQMDGGAFRQASTAPHGRENRAAEGIIPPSQNRSRPRKHMRCWEFGTLNALHAALCSDFDKSQPYKSQPY